MTNNMKHDTRMLPISNQNRNRHRKDLGDLYDLAASIEKGLLQPIGVSPEMELIWGSPPRGNPRCPWKRRDPLSNCLGRFDRPRGVRREHAPQGLHSIRTGCHRGDPPRVCPRWRPEVGSRSQLRR